MTLAQALSASRWQTKRELAEKLGTTPREVEAAVEAARKAGELAILSGPDGYRLATSSEEYERNVASRKRRVMTQLVTIRGERRLIRRWNERRELTLPWAWWEREA